jgi:hypothetical protein
VVAADLPHRRREGDDRLPHHQVEVAVQVEDGHQSRHRVAEVARLRSREDLGHRPDQVRQERLGPRRDRVLPLPCRDRKIFEATVRQAEGQQGPEPSGLPPVIAPRACVEMRVSGTRRGLLRLRLRPKRLRRRLEVLRKRENDRSLL